jgi:hypothetical protein
MKKRLDKKEKAQYIDIKQTIDWNKRLINSKDETQNRRRNNDQDYQKYQGDKFDAPSRSNAHFSRDHQELIERPYKGGDNNDKILTVFE